ncbi:hypothetical protein AO376_0808 [Moraxella catarrhalis]|nr:hypothetical protein AO376_0808 [Moraxella catarrhalis]OAV17395.1 hypothetical protein AO374_1182 [Moraxella catarrhalis]
MLLSCHQFRSNITNGRASIDLLLNFCTNQKLITSDRLTHFYVSQVSALLWFFI